MAVKRSGPIAKTIENLCVGLCSGNIAETGFNEGIKEIVQKGVSLMSIGMALQRSATEYCKGSIDYIWRLVDEVEPKIRKDWERYQTGFLGATSSGLQGPDSHTKSTRRIVACWHHGDIKRLSDHLRFDRIDLYGQEEVTKRGRQRRDRWWNRLMRLQVDDRIQIVVKGQIIATATIAKVPEDFPQGIRPWRSVVYLKDIYRLNPLPARCHRLQSSHRFDGPKTSLLMTLS